MNKVIRDARISDEPIRIDDLDSRLGLAFRSEEANSEFVSLDEITGRNTEEEAPPAEEEETVAEADADASQEEIEALVAQSQKRSAVYDVVTNPTDVAVEVQKQ